MGNAETRVSRRGFAKATVGATTIAATGTANAQTEAAGGGETHTVDMTDDLVFDPDSITIAPGDTIVWENVGNVGHSVTAYEAEIPEEAEYFASGGFDSEQPARNNYSPGDPDAGDIPGGESFQHTFEATGEYEYFCVPHETVGMVASVTVQEGGVQAPADGAPAGPKVPDIATNAAIFLTTGLLAVLSFTYLLIRFGGDYRFED